MLGIDRFSSYNLSRRLKSSFEYTHSVVPYLHAEQRRFVKLRGSSTTDGFMTCCVSLLSAYFPVPKGERRLLETRVLCSIFVRPCGPGALRYLGFLQKRLLP